MLHPSHHAAANPDKPAMIVAETGETMSYAALDAASNRAAHLFRTLGLRRGDTVAFLLENHIRYFELAWGAQRSGLYFVCVSSKLTAPEIDYILSDCGAALLVMSAAMAGEAGALRTGIRRLVIGPQSGGGEDFDVAAAGLPTTPIADESAGIDMLYSSGTTGKPKGVKMQLPDPPDIGAPTILAQLGSRAYGMGPDSIYLSPAPLYHAAPLRWSMTVQRLGGTVIMMRHFDAAEALATIERHAVTHSQWVPTHFVRMLKLPDEIRTRHDLSSLKVAIHAAAPCPIPAKRAMIDWWGPVIEEYYAGSEGVGITMIGTKDWLAHPGSVGRAVHGIARVCGEDGEELPRGQEGLIHFESTTVFEYHNDPQKTASGRNAQGWATLGDIGWMDGDGFLYLTDRASFMIISGGVNIYPQEIENHLVTHPRVADVAVIGAPHAEMGEEVVAVVQPMDMAEADDRLAAELTAFCRASLSGVKTPRRFDFVEELPRHATGKLYKRLLRDTYWGKGAGTIV